MSIRMRIAAVALSLAGILGTAAAPVSASVAPTAVSQVTASGRVDWMIDSLYTGCLVNYQSGAVRTEPCDYGDRSQRWHWINSSWNTGERMLRNTSTGKCLVEAYPEVRSGDCHDWTSRHWKRITEGSSVNYHDDYLQSDSTNLFLDAYMPGHSSALTLTSMDGYNSQWEWKFIRR